MLVSCSGNGEGSKSELEGFKVVILMIGKGTFSGQPHPNKYSRVSFMSAPFKLLIGFFVFATLLTGCQRNSVAQRSDVETKLDAAAIAPASAKVALTLGPDVAEGPVSGRLLVLFSTGNPSPITGPDWFAPEPFASTAVTDWVAGETLKLSPEVMTFPKSLRQLDPGKYHLQAVLRRNPDFAHHKDGPGNLYSEAQVVNLRSGQHTTITLELTKVVPLPTFEPTPTSKIISQRSALLSAFHGRDVIDRALVLLPPDYDSQAHKSYPVYYEITGFGPTIEDMLKHRKVSAIASGGVEFIHVILSGQTQWGHHVYANSQTNGPRGDALVNELIPEIEKRFRAIPKPYARLLGGHSSGGWSSLWLQTHYSKFFGGVWSTSPDPVDFRDWQGTNLYQSNANIFTDPEGRRRPLAIANGNPVLWYDDFSKMDDVLERGGQLRSFEAVFSPRGDDGLPVQCWDRDTGEVDPDIIEHWKQYDISHHLRDHWDDLKDDLAGKIHIYTGSQDTFLLTKAVQLLKQRLQDLNSDAQVEILDGHDHFDILASGLPDRIYQSMAEKFSQAVNGDGSTSR